MIVTGTTMINLADLLRKAGVPKLNKEVMNAATPLFQQEVDDEMSDSAPDSPPARSGARTAPSSEAKDKLIAERTPGQEETQLCEDDDGDDDSRDFFSDIARSASYLDEAETVSQDVKYDFDTAAYDRRVAKEVWEAFFGDYVIDEGKGKGKGKGKAKSSPNASPKPKKRKTSTYFKGPIDYSIFYKHWAKPKTN